MKSKISIIIPVFNVEEYIEECISSVLNQTIRRFEVIIVDDCTPDNSISKIEYLFETHNTEGIEIKMIRHDKNKGLSAARNTGIKYATGDYLYFLDSDDYLYNNCIESFTCALQLYPGVDIIQGNTKSNSSEISKWFDIRKHPDYSTNKKWFSFAFLVPRFMPVTSWNKLYRRQLLVDNNLIFKENIIHEDVHWIFHLSKVIKSYAAVKDFTYFYRIRSNSIMTNLNIKKEYESISFLIEDIIAHLSPPGKLFQRHRYCQLFFYNIFCKKYYEQDDQVDRLYKLIWSSSSTWGRFVLFVWKIIPKDVKRIKCIASSLSWFYCIF